MKNVLKDLFKSRLIRFSLLGCLLFCLGLHLYTQWDLKRFETSLQKERPSTLDPADAETSDAATPTENAQGGHFHSDGTFHAGPHETDAPAEVPLQAPEMSEAEIEEFYRSQGLEPPPPGYTYIQHEDGSTELIEDGVPQVTITYKNQFDRSYLSEKDWVTYQALKGITHKRVIESRKIPPEVVTLAKERIKALEQKGQGPYPYASSLTTWSGPRPPGAQEKIDRIMNEKIAEAKAELGLSNARKTVRYDYNLIEQLLIELQEEVTE